MEIDKIKDVKQLKAMIHATRSHLARIASDLEPCKPDVMGEMQLDLMRLMMVTDTTEDFLVCFVPKLRLEELFSDEGE